MDIGKTGYAAVWTAMAWLLAVPGAVAQSVWTGNDGGTHLRLEWVKPNLDGGADLTFLSSATFVSVRAPLSETVGLFGELPFAYGKPDFSGADGELAIGNPYVGLKIQTGGSDAFIEVGSRVPVAPEDKLVPFTVGLASDLRRWEAFVPNLLPINLFAGYRRVDPSGLLVHVRGGPVTWFFTEGDIETELFLRAEGNLGYLGPSFGVVAGFSTLTIITESDIDFGERSLFQFGLEAWLELESVRPGIVIRLPADDDYGDLVDYTLGLTLEVPLSAND